MKTFYCRVAGMGIKEQFRLTDQGRQLAYFLEDQMGVQEGGRQDAGAAPPQGFSPGHRRLSGQGHRIESGGFPEVMIERGREIERGSNLQQVEEVEAAVGEGFRLYKAACKSSTAMRKKYNVQLHVQVTLGEAECAEGVFAGRRPELVTRLKEMGFGEERVLAALAATDYDEGAAVQVLLDGGSAQPEAPGGVTKVVVVRSECGCPEGRSSGGKCKHAAALFLRVDDHLQNGAELDRPEPGKKKASGKKRGNGDGETAPKRRKTGAGAGAPLASEGERSLGAIAAQLAKSVGDTTTPPKARDKSGASLTPPKHRGAARSPLGASPREMAAQAAFERAAMQASLQKESPARAAPVGQRNVDFVDLEEGSGRAQEPRGSAQGIGRAVSANRESRAETSKGKEAAGRASQGVLLEVGRATPGKGKAVAFVDLDSDPNDVDSDSSEDAALLSVDWKSPRASWGSAAGASELRETSEKQQGGRGRMRDLDDDSAPDLAELDRLVDTVTAAAEPGSAPSASAREKCGQSAETGGLDGLGGTSGMGGAGGAGGMGGTVRQVTVVVDETERQTNSNPNSVYLELHRQAAALKPVAGAAVAAEKHKLETGDYLWLAETEEGR